MTAFARPEECPTISARLWSPATEAAARNSAARSAFFSSPRLSTRYRARASPERSPLRRFRVSIALDRSVSSGRLLQAGISLIARRRADRISRLGVNRSMRWNTPRNLPLNRDSCDKRNSWVSQALRQLFIASHARLNRVTRVRGIRYRSRFMKQDRGFSPEKQMISD